MKPILRRYGVKKVLLIYVTDTSEVERYLLDVDACEFDLLRCCNHKSIGYAEEKNDIIDLQHVYNLTHNGIWKHSKMEAEYNDKPYPALDGVFVVLE